jgi:agmatinase
MKVNFGGLTPEYTGYPEARIVILPVGFDRTSTWIKGSEKGPAAIIEASPNLELYDIETGTEVFRRGIHTASELRPRDIDSLNTSVYTAVKRYLEEGRFTVVLGGEHTVSYGAVKAHLEKYVDLSILHLDAHTDMRDIYEGNRFSHACVMARIRELTGRITSVGIRSMDSSELENVEMDRVFMASDLQQGSRWLRKAVRQLTGRVYVSIDLDVFDPGIMPSTGTPEPGGLTWYQCIDLLRKTAQAKRIVGFDVVELCPGEEKAPDFLAAKLVYTLLSFVFHYE